MTNALLQRLRSDRPLIMGILNVTPDSFSDGGAYLDVPLAMQRVALMASEGADLIDVGGESTRPGSLPVSPEEQCRRITPVLDALCELRERSMEVPFMSVDTSSSLVAEAALRRGGVMVNDVTAGLGDPLLLEVVARYGAFIVLMHMKGTPLTMQESPHYDDVVAEVVDFLMTRAEAAMAAGVPREHIMLDPGIGFGKTREHNLTLLRHLDAFTALGYPVLLGCSRKRFMGSLCQESNPEALVGATVATTVLGLSKGVRLFRVHDVKPNRQAADVTWQLARPN